MFSKDGTVSGSKSVKWRWKKYSDACDIGFKSTNKHKPITADNVNVESVDSHEKCLKAADYEGCMEFNGSTNE